MGSSKVSYPRPASPMPLRAFLPPHFRPAHARTRPRGRLVIPHARTRAQPQHRPRMNPCRHERTRQSECLSASTLEPEPPTDPTGTNRQNEPEPILDNAAATARLSAQTSSARDTIEPGHRRNKPEPRACPLRRPRALPALQARTPRPNPRRETNPSPTASLPHGPDPSPPTSHSLCAQRAQAQPLPPSLRSASCPGAAPGPPSRR